MPFVLLVKIHGSIYAILLKIFWAKVFQRFKKTSVRNSVPPLSRRETISQVCRVLESTSIRQIKMWLLFVEPYRISRNSDSSALHDQCNYFAVVIMASLQLTQGMGRIHGCSGIRRLYHALAGQWFKRDEQIDLTTLAIFIAFSLWTFGPWQNAPPLNELQFVSSRQRTGCRGA